MDLKFAVPNMKETFGKLTFAGEGEVVERRNGRNTKVISRTYNLFSDKQRADDVEVIITGDVSQKAFDFEDEIELVKPRIIAEGRNIAGKAYTNYIMYADEIKKVQ